MAVKCAALPQIDEGGATLPGVMPPTGFVHFHRFATPIGRCTIVWGDQGVLGLDLPHTADDGVAHSSAAPRRHRAAREAPPPAAVRQAIERIVALLHGEPDDLSGIVLDLRGIAEFERRVYELARAIPPGRTSSYGELAQRLGAPGAARAVGRALGANPFAVIVPCHRVLAAGGRSGGFSAPGGVATKLKLLEIEGARIGNGPTLFDL